MSSKVFNVEASVGISEGRGWITSSVSYYKSIHKTKSINNNTMIHLWHHNILFGKLSLLKYEIVPFLALATLEHYDSLEYVPWIPIFLCPPPPFEKHFLYFPGRTNNPFCKMFQIGDKLQG